MDDVVIHVHTLHPGDPHTLDAISQAAARGLEQKGTRMPKTITTAKATAQIGWSPKVLIPGLVLFGVGLVCIIVGVIIKEPDLRTIGYSVLGAGVVALGAGRAAKPGTVEVAIPSPKADKHAVR